MNTITRFVAVAALTVGVMPCMASALSLSASAQSQLAQITTTLVSVLTQINTAVAQGDSYLASGAYQTQLASWTQAIAQMQSMLVAIVTQASQGQSVAQSACPSFVGTLGLGDQGNAVAQVQQFLMTNGDAGYTGTASGIFDLATQAAVQRFQAAQGIVSSGSPDSTGYGRVGPTTRSVMASLCAIAARQVASPTYQPATGVTGTSATVSTATASASVSGSTATFTITANPALSCGALTFNLSFGDGQQQTLTFPASCSAQTQTVTHTYNQAGGYTALITNGAFSMNLTITVSAVSTVSTGSLVVQGLSGDPYGATFLITANPNSACGTPTYTLTFGDGQQQSLTFPASCSTQTQTVYHRFASYGGYVATLSSGTFSTNLQFTVPLPGSATVATSTFSAYVGSSGTINVPVVVQSGSACTSLAYTVGFGDGTTQTLTFPFTTSSCGTQTLTATHTYATNGTYTVYVVDPSGTTQTASFTVAGITSAGAGDPFAVLTLHGEGANGATSIVDSSSFAHLMTAYGNARIDTGTAARGASSFAFDGSGDYITTASSTDFNFGSGNFTVDLWFNAASFPASNQQVSLIQQANSGATDASLGGAGLELFGNQLYFVGSIGNVIYHPFYSDTIHSDALSTNTWYHAAAVRLGSVLTLYLNGVKVGSTNVSGSANASSNMLSVGRYGEFNGDYFNGHIDDVDIAKGLARWTGNFNPSTGVVYPKSIPAGDLSWTLVGATSGKSCALFNPATEPTTTYWADNYVCGSQPYGFILSSSGPLSAMSCVNITEPADPNLGSNIYLCSPNNYGLMWSYTGPISGKQCFQVTETAVSSGYGWDNNYLCY